MEKTDAPEQKPAEPKAEEPKPAAPRKAAAKRSAAKQAVPSPKKIIKKKARELEHDVFAYIWAIFIAVFIILTIYFKTYVKEMIVISALFLIFWFIEPLMFGVTGKTVTTILSKGKEVAEWKRFPLFFLVIIFLYVLYNGIGMVISMAFPEESINVVFVVMWLGFLYLLWVYKFSKEK
ncbi:MAG: hypothetical protein QXD77_00980 [Candidatus Aenigmatarchaeota archaeon]